MAEETVSADGGRTRMPGPITQRQAGPWTAMLELGHRPPDRQPENDTWAKDHDESASADNERLDRQLVDPRRRRAKRRLILLSDVEAVRNGDPRRGDARKIAVVTGLAWDGGERQAGKGRRESASDGGRHGHQATRPSRHSPRHPTVVTSANEASRPGRREPTGTYCPPTASASHPPVARPTRHGKRNPSKLDDGAVEAVIGRRAQHPAGPASRATGTFEAGDR